MTVTEKPELEITTTLSFTESTTVALRVSVPVEVGVFLSRRITQNVISEPMNSLHYITAFQLFYSSSTLPFRYHIYRQLILYELVHRETRRAPG
eukprot:IDg15992t1